MTLARQRARISSQQQLELDAKIARIMARRKPRSFRLSARNTSVAGLVFLAVSLLLWRNGSQNGLDIYPLSRAVDWDARREEVKEAFVTSWDAYSKYAWG
jgi:mannosyl-oligosaccharide alpha-1,2-mannosidase